MRSLLLENEIDDGIHRRRSRWLPANDPNGLITIDVAVALTPPWMLWLKLDADLNGRTDEHEDRLIGTLIEPSGRTTNVVYGGDRTALFHPVTASVTAAGVRYTFANWDVPLIEKAFAFMLETYGANYPASDRAPDEGLWLYTLTVSPVKPMIGKPTTSLPAPRAGQRFVVSFPVTRSDPGAPLTTGKIVCNPSIGGRVLRHAESFVGGRARLSLLVPKSARGSLLRIKVTIVVGKESATKVASFRVRWHEVRRTR